MIGSVDFVGKLNRFASSAHFLIANVLLNNWFPRLLLHLLVRVFDQWLDRGLKYTLLPNNAGIPRFISH